MAGVKFSGDTMKLLKLIGQFDSINTRRFRRDVNGKLAATALELANDGFERSITPYGQRWRNPKYRKGQPLRDTGRLQGSLRAKSTSETFSITSNVVYAAPHLFGWPERNIPQRQFLPIGAEGFGGRWRKELFGVYHSALMAALEMR